MNDEDHKTYRLALRLMLIQAMMDVAVLSAVALVAKLIFVYL